MAMPDNSNNLKVSWIMGAIWWSVVCVAEEWDALEYDVLSGRVGDHYKRRDNTFPEALTITHYC